MFLNSSQASIVGGGDTVDFSSGSGNVATLSGHGFDRRRHRGVAGTVDLDGATAKATNNGDAFAFRAPTSSICWNSRNHGVQPRDRRARLDRGRGSSDVFQFSSADFANFAALQAHMTQSGANTVISLGASDAVTLDNVAVSSLSSGQFKFV